MKKNRAIIFSILAFVCVAVIVLVIETVSKSNYTKYIKDIYKSDESLRIHKENNTVYVINSLSGENVKVVADTLTSKNIKPKEKLVFCSNMNIDENNFYDENLKGTIETINSKINYTYINTELIERKNEVILPFEVYDIKEDNDKIYITVNITGGEKSDIIGEAKLITDEIININKIDKNKEVITKIKTETFEYEVSTKHDNVIKVSN